MKRDNPLGLSRFFIWNLIMADNEFKKGLDTFVRMLHFYFGGQVKYNKKNDNIGNLK